MMNQLTIKYSLICMIGCFVCLIQFLVQCLPGIMVTPLSDFFGINKAQVGFLSSAFFYSYIFFQIPAGFIVDRVGAKISLLFTCVVLIAGLLGWLVSYSYSQVLFARFFMGLGCAPVVVACMNLAFKYFPRYFALWVGIIEMTGMLGSMMADMIVEDLVHQFDWRFALQITMVAICFAFLVVLIFIPYSPQSSITDSSINPKTKLVDNLKAILASSEAWCFFLYGGFTFAIISAFAALWSIPFLQNCLMQGNHLAAKMTGLVFIGSGVGSITAGLLVKRMPIWTILKYFSFMSIVSLSLVLCLTGHTFLTGIALFTLGFSIGSYTLTFEGVKNLASTQNQGIAMGFNNMMSMILGAIILQPLIGFLLDQLDSKDNITQFQLAFSPLIAILIMAFLIACHQSKKNAITSKLAFDNK